jgi:hypothetical protein
MSRLNSALAGHKNRKLIDAAASLVNKKNAKKNAMLDPNMQKSQSHGTVMPNCA